MAKCKQARLCSFGLTKCWLRLQFLAMAKCKQTCLCSFGLTKLFDNLSQICTMRQKRNSQKKESSSFFENRQCEQQKVTRSTAQVVPRGLRKASVVNSTIRIDNACSNRSREAPRQWCRVGCEKRVLSILLSESTMRAAKGHANIDCTRCEISKQALLISLVCRYLCSSKQP